jgi:gamma-glutamyltranspeptidase/glutathione hydrolase
MARRSLLRVLVLAAVVLAAPAAATQPAAVADLSPASWPSGEYEKFITAQGVDRTTAGVATGQNGAVTVAYNGIAARAGLEALKRGGNAIDAAMTAAVTQVTVTAGAPISYFGILSLVYYDAKSGRVYTMNAEWNTVRGETSPATIPGSLNLATPEGLRGTAVSGRTTLVGGFLKGVGAAHQRFGRLKFARLFDTAIYVADHGMPVTAHLAEKFVFRHEDLSRLPATRAIFMKADGAAYRQGEIFRQPALAATLRAVAREGTDYIYKGPWAKKLVAAVQADGGTMTLEDLAAYDVIWDEPLVADLGPYQLQTNRPPNDGGVNMVEAQQLAVAAGLADGPHWTTSGASLKKALDITQMYVLGYLPDAVKTQVYPGIPFTPEARVQPARAADLWRRMQAGAVPFRWKAPAGHHSDDVVAIDKDGNIAAITQSINCVDWGRTAINIDGISIGDPASFQQAAIAKIPPGTRLPAPTETGILFRDGRPVLGFASMGSGLHQRTFQALLNVMRFGMTVDAAIDTADFLMPDTDLRTGQLTFRVPKGRFSRDVLDAVGYKYEEVDPTDMRFGGEGLWVAISRDPKTGLLRAASHNRNNSAAVAW